MRFWGNALVFYGLICCRLRVCSIQPIEDEMNGSTLAMFSSQTLLDEH